MTETGKDNAQQDAAAEAYDRLLAMLLEGEAAPGGVLYETVLGRRLGLSRTPVREALARLNQDGLIDRSARGYTVKQLTPAEIIQVFDVKTLLDRQVGFDAANNITPLELYELEQLNDLVAVKLLAAVSSDQEGQNSIFRQIHAINHQWHSVVLEASKNMTLQRLVGQLLKIQTMYNPRMTVQDLEGFRAVHDTHCQIVEAFRGHSATLAAELMVRHSQESRDARVAAFMKSENGGEL